MTLGSAKIPAEARPSENTNLLNLMIGTKDFYAPSQPKLSYRFSKVQDIDDINERTIETLRTAIEGKTITKKRNVLKRARNSHQAETPSVTIGIKAARQRPQSGRPMLTRIYETELPLR